MAWVTPIYNRQLSDVKNKTAIGLFNVSDWNRIYGDTSYLLAEVLSHTLLSITPALPPVLVPAKAVTPGYVQSGAVVNGTSMSWSHILTAGSNQFIVVGVACVLSTVSGINFGTHAMTKWAAVTYTSPEPQTYRIEYWYLDCTAAGVGTGTYTVAVTFAANDYAEGGSIDFINVNRAAPLSAMQSTSGLILNPSLSVVKPQGGGVIMDLMCLHNGSGTDLPEAHQTLLWDLTSDGSWKSRASLKPVPTSNDTFTMSWALASGLNYWTYGQVVVNPDPTGATSFSAYIPNVTDFNSMLASIDAMRRKANALGAFPALSAISTLVYAAGPAATPWTYVDVNQWEQCLQLIKNFFDPLTASQHYWPGFSSPGQNLTLANHWFGG